MTNKYHKHIHEQNCATGNTYLQFFFPSPRYVPFRTHVHSIINFFGGVWWGVCFCVLIFIQSHGTLRPNTGMRLLMSTLISASPRPLHIIFFWCVCVYQVCPIKQDKTVGGWAWGVRRSRWGVGRGVWKVLGYGQRERKRGDDQGRRSINALPVCWTRFSYKTHTHTLMDTQAHRRHPLLWWEVSWESMSFLPSLLLLPSPNT